MAGSFIRLESDSSEVRVLLADILQKVLYPAPVLEEIGEYLLLSHDDRWDRRISPGGEPWVKPSPGYAKHKAAAGKSPADILELEGNLRRLLRYQVTGDGLEFGTDRPYGAAHQFGRPERNLPARPWLGISDSDEAAILDILRDYLADSLR